jgi:TRAP-type C4-dicarboxylate transport system permease small subunit
VTELVTDGAGAAALPRRPTASPPAAAAAKVAFVPYPITRPLLFVSDLLAALMLGVDLLVVIGSVVARTTFNAPVEWADDVARGLMVGSTFFGAASATARHESLGIAFFAARLPPRLRELVDTVTWLLILGLSAYVAFYTIDLSLMTTGQTTGSGLPLEWTFYPMGGGMICMTAFAAETIVRCRVRRIVESVAVVAVVVGAYMAWAAVLPDALPSSGALMLAALVVTLFGGLPIGFVLVLATLVFVLTQGSLPGVIVSQQMARGIDSFVMLAIPFFILVGYLMEANGMSVRLIEALRRMVCAADSTWSWFCPWCCSPASRDRRRRMSPLSARCSSPRPSGPSRTPATRSRCWVRRRSWRSRSRPASTSSSLPSSRTSRSVACSWRGSSLQP